MLSEGTLEDLRHLKLTRVCHMSRIFMSLFCLLIIADGPMNAYTYIFLLLHLQLFYYLV